MGLDGQTPANQLPLETHHINHLAQVYGAGTAQRVVVMARHYQDTGGMNPAAVECVFPKGPEGPLDEDQLLLLLGNFTVWNA